MNIGAATGAASTFTLSAGGTSTGDWAIAAGSALHVALGTPYLFDNGTDITGPGVLTANNAGVANVGDAATDFVNIANVVLDDGFTLNAVGTANISGALMMGPGNSTGTLTGPGDVNVAGLITWNTGTMSGSGRTFANGDIAFNVLGGGATLNGRRLDNARTATWTNLGQGNLFFSNGAIFNNNGIFEIQNNANILNNGGAASAFNNNGTFRKVVATGVTEIRIPFNNSNTGVVDVQTGTVNFSGGGTSTGSWTVAAPAVLEFGGGTHNLNAGGVAGAGLVRFTNGTTHSAGTYNVTATQIDSAGVANFNAAASTGTLALGNAVNQAGTLGGAANFTISGLFTWFTGLMNGDGTTFANGGINLDVKSGGATLSRRLDNALMAVWTGTDVISFNNGVFNNNGTFDVQIDRTIFNVGTSSFDNNGTFKKSAGAGLLDVDVAFTNDGTVEVLTGTVSFDGTLTNLTGGTLNGGTWIVRDNASLLTPGANITENQANVTLEGVTSSFPKFNAIASNTATGSFTIQNGRIFTTSAAYSNAGSTTISAGSVFLVPAGNNYTQTAGTTTVDGSLTADAILINGGTLLGVGVLHGDVSNAGHVAPGTSPGVLVIDGDYTQTAAGVLDVEIASATMFDQLQISGAASLDGTINVTRPGGFVPVLNDAFPVLTFASRTGDFAVKNGFLLGNALAFTEQFNPTNLTLVVTQNQLSFQTQPPAMLLSGQPFEVKVLVSDSTGNPLLGNNVDQVTLTINQHAFQGGATFVTQPVVNGVATFNLTIAQGAAGYVLTAGGNGFANVLSGSFAVHVPPTITSVNNATFTVGSPASFTIETTGFPAPSLRIGSFLLPAGLSFLDNGNGAATLSGTPTGNVGGVYLFTITAHNAASPDATQNFTLTVNQAPAIISANNTSFTSGAAGSFTVQATGFPSASLSIGGFTLPAGVSFLDNGNGAATLSGTPAQGSEGVYSFTITAANGIGENATQNFTLTVNGLAIVSADHATFAEGTFGTFNVLTTGFPIPTLSDGGFVFPTGVSFLDNGDGTATLSGTPATGTAGNYQFTITAQNGVNPNATQSFTLTITPPVLAPQITSANSAIFIVGSSSSFNITTTGLPTPSLNIGGFILPAGLTFTDPGNGTASLAGTPTGNVGGTYNFTITAQNGIAPDATQSFTLTINQAAAITSANNTTFTVGTAGSFTATTTGFPTASLNIGDFVLPPGLSFVNLGNGAATLSGAPAANTGGVYTFDIAAQNGVGNAAAQSFTLTINQAAAITSANNATFTVGTAGSFTVTTTGFPKPTLDIGGFQLPNGLACLDKGDGTATLSGTPTGNVGGIYTFTITAQNGIAPDATQPFTLTINQAPAITSANNTTFTVGTAGSLIVTTTGFPTPSLNIGDFVLPPGLTFVNLGNGAATLSGAPAANSGGVYTFDIAARNGVGSAATQPFTLTINQAAAITSANTATFIVGTPGSFIVTTTGFPKPSLDIGGFQLPNGLAFLDNADGTATLSGTPTGNVGGIYTFTITAQNGIAPDATRPFTLTINLAPAITSANNTTFTVGTAGSFTVTTTGFPTPSLNIGDFVLPPGLSFVNLGNGAATLSGVPAANTGGVYTFDIAAQNGVGSAAVQSFTLTINQAAAITSANNATFTVGTAGSFTVTTTGFPKPSLDIGGFVLTNGVNFLDNGDGTATLSGTPSGNVGGIYTFTITAQNGIGDAATQPFTLTVNQVAAITSANSAIFTVETLGSFTVSTTGFPKPSLNIGGFILPPGLAFTDNFDGTATLSGMPTGNVGGIYHFTITAQNGIGTNATQDFTLTVHQAAAITSANIVAFTVATPGSFTITTTGFPKPTIDIGAFIMPMGLFFSDLGDGTATLIGTPAPNVGGTYTFTIAATNGIASAATQNFTLTVNQAPAITSADNATFTVGVSGSFTVTATGFPTPTLSKGAFVLPNGLTFTNNGNGAATLAGPPVGNVGGTYHFDITAQNGIGADALQAFTLTINQAPTITLNPVNKTVLSSQSVTFTAAANGFPVPNVQWQRSSDGGVNFSDLAADADYSGVNSTDLTIAAALGAMTGHRFRAVFTNAAGNATTTAAILTVVSKPSIILQPANKITTAGLAVTFSAAAAAVPAATVRWQISLNGGATYVNLVNTTAFTGVFTNTLRILRPSMAHNGARFRAVYTNIHGSETTTAAILTVNPPLSVVPATLPIVKRFVPISLTIRATGGTGVRHITYKLSKLLPSGLTISPVSPTTGDITISGKTAVAFNVTITITVTDDLGAKKIVNLVLRTSLLPTRRGF